MNGENIKDVEKQIEAVLGYPVHLSLYLPNREAVKLAEYMNDVKYSKSGECHMTIYWSFTLNKTATPGVIQPIIASFILSTFPGCCGLLVSTRAYVNQPYRNKGINTILNRLRIDLSRYLGFTTLVCTDVAKNTPQKRVLIKNGWKDVHSFKNKRTGNTVDISLIDL